MEFFSALSTWCFLLQDAVSMVQAIDDAQHAATKLTSEAYNKGSADNITCVVVRFHHGGKRG